MRTWIVPDDSKAVLLGRSATLLRRAGFDVQNYLLRLVYSRYCEYSGVVLVSLTLKSAEDETPEPMARVLSTKGLEWIEARVPNYAEMKKFYRNTLGLPLNFEEERKDFIQFKVGSSKTYLALLDLKKTGMTRSRGFVPTFEVPDLGRFVRSMKEKGVKVGRRIVEGDHVRLVDFFDPNGNLLQAFEWKKKAK